MKTTIETISVKNESRGRKTQSKTNRVRRSVVKAMKENNNQPMTANVIARQSRQGKVVVGQALRWLEKNGVIARVGSEKVTGGRGRPSTVYKVVEEGSKINPAQQAYVREFREYQRTIAEKTFEERKEIVANALDTLMKNQTDDEQEVRESMYQNKLGFTKADAKRGMEDATKEHLTLEDVNYWLNARRLYKYRKQINLV